jgi:transposase
MATFQGRRAEEGIAWCNRRPHAERQRVAVVVWEMSKTFLAAVKAVCGDHVHVIARFHVVPQAVSALDAVWRSGPKPLDPEEAKARKQRRQRWLKSSAPLTVAEWMARDEWQRRFPALRETLAWVQD